MSSPPFCKLTISQKNLKVNKKHLDKYPKDMYINPIDNRKEVERLAEININLTDDPLKNIILMAPYLDEPGQNRVFGMICGLIGFNGNKTGQKDLDRKEVG